MIKTVLAPNAPWPHAVEQQKPAPKPKRKWVPKPNHSKRKQTDANFEAWLKGNA